MDRVEAAYLAEFLSRPDAIWVIARTPAGFLLSDRSGAEALHRGLQNGFQNPPDRMSKTLARGRTDPVLRAESTLRRHAVARIPRWRLSSALKRHVPTGADWFAVGLSNIDPRVFRAVREGLGGRAIVMIHDVIPLEFPERQRPESPPRFRRLLETTAGLADLVIYNSADTQRRAEAKMPPGRIPDGRVAPLGVDLARPDPSDLPDGLSTDTPYFVTLGTIEPRKRHDILLDVWEDLARDCGAEATPRLYIIGQRGWQNADLFRRLDALDPEGPVCELGSLPDGAVAHLLRGAVALLSPSEAEGYGLAPLEAAALGTTIVVSNLDIFRETLGKIPVYVTETDRYHWRNAVESCLAAPPARPSATFEPPSWASHFNTVLRWT